MGHSKSETESICVDSENAKFFINKKQILFITVISIVICYIVFRYCWRSNIEMDGCVFCSIVEGRTNTVIEKETNDYVIFKDIRPACTYHYLAVSKKHIESLQTITEDDRHIIDKLHRAMKEFMSSIGIEEDVLLGFHMPPFITVRHLHLHGIAPASKMRWLMRIIFKAHSFWFKSVNEAHTYVLNRNSTF